LLEQVTMRVAGMLRRHGVTPGDRVALMIPNVPQFAAVYFGILRTGAIVVPLNVLNRRRELEFFLRDSGATLLFAWESFAAEAQPAAAETGCDYAEVDVQQFTQKLFEIEPLTELTQRADSDTAVMLYTSGTTGTPKGA